MFRQLDIYWVDLEPTRGAETQKQRPCVILQGNLINRNSRTFIVVPVLPRHRSWPFAVNIQPSPKNGLDKARHLNLKQLRVVDTSRISNQLGQLEDRYLPEIQQKLNLIFDL